MAWTVEFNAYAERKLRRLDPKARGRILKYLQDNLEGTDDARIFGRALRGNPPTAGAIALEIIELSAAWTIMTRK